MTRNKHLWLLAGLLLLLTMLVAGASQGARAQARPLLWAQINPITLANINDVFMVDENTAWAVGGGTVGVVYELNWLRDHWNITERGTFRAWLNAVSVLPDNDVWAVGNNGLIAHKTPDGWREISNPVPNANLQTLQMFSHIEGWAGGYIPGLPPGGSAVVLHFKDGQWTRDRSVTSALNEGGISALHFAQDGGWAVGDGIRRYHNGTWTKEAEPEPCDVPGQCVRSYSSVRAINSGEAWAVGIAQGFCIMCRPFYYAIHRQGGSWQRVLPDPAVTTQLPEIPLYSNLKRVTFTGDGVGMAVGVYSPSTDYGADLRPLILSYRNGQWSYENSPVRNGDLNAVSAINSTHALAVGNVGLVLSYGYESQVPPTPTAGPTATPYPTPFENPTNRVPDWHNPNVIYFPLTGHTLGGGFRDYWQAHGGLAQFGYPLTEEFIEVSPTNNKPYTVQYFERARFEWHPKNLPPYDVLLGLLGRTVTAGREYEQPFRRTPPQLGPGTLYFPETGHNMPAQFVQYWRTHGGLPVYGYPISEAFNEVSPTDGRTYMVQYYERNRFEYHPELPEAYRVSLGLLGVQVARMKGWLP